jgi:hypothetical protein
MVVPMVTLLKAARKKKPSFSPVKAAPAKPTPKTRAQSDNVITPRPVIDGFGPDLATASLEFEEFSFWDDDGVNMKNPTKQQMVALSGYLADTYKVAELQISQPFLILWCKGGVPDQHQRPFSIVGCIAVWLDEGDEVPGDLSIGDFGGPEIELTVDDDIAADLQPFHLPKAQTLISLAEHFPGCSHVSFLAHQIIIEFPEEDDESWHHRRQNLPESITNVGLPLTYNNGPLVAAELKRLKKPKPGVLASAQADDTDYVKSQSCFHPGTMLKADSGDHISAGIAVQKGGETRVTVAFHCWDKEYESVPDKLGDEGHFAVTQGETKVGHLLERVGLTDVGLMKVNKDVAFSNRFLDIDATAKVLMPMSGLAVSDEFLIDSFVTGRQRMRL